MWKRNIPSRHIARCSGFPLHNFLTGSDSQKFRVSAYSPINTVIECDASKGGLGAALLQDGRLLAYASRAWTSAERD